MIAAHHQIAGEPGLNKVAYLQSDGSQWIDTGIYQTDSIEMFCRFMPVGRSVEWGTYCGCGAQDSSARNLLIRHPGSNIDKVSIWFAQTDFTTNEHQVDASQMIDVSVRFGECTVNGVSHSIPSVAGRLAHLTIGLFCWNGAPSAQGPRRQPCRIESFWLKDAGRLVLDYEPVEVDGIGYMHDRVTKRLFGNVGTGSFILP